MSKYFERGIKRESATARLPLSVSTTLSQKRDFISGETGIKISKNDLVTIGAILIAESKITSEQLAEVESMSDLLSLFRENF